MWAGPDGLHIIPLPTTTSTGYTEFVVVTVAVKTTGQWNADSPAAVSAADVRSNVGTCRASRMYTRREGDAEDTEVIALMARTAVFVRIHVCLPRVGSTAAVEPTSAHQPAVEAPVCYVLDAYTGKPCVIINVTSSNITALLPVSGKGTLFHRLLQISGLAQNAHISTFALPTTPFPY